MVEADGGGEGGKGTSFLYHTTIIIIITKLSSKEIRQPCKTGEEKM